MLKRKKMQTIIATTLILLVCFFVGLYIFAIRSEPYKFALEYIAASPMILENIGSLESKRLAFFGYDVRYNGPRGRAEYKILIQGAKKGGHAYLKLEKSAGIWKVVEGNLILKDGDTISLTKENS